LKRYLKKTDNDEKGDKKMKKNLRVGTILVSMVLAAMLLVSILSPGMAFQQEITPDSVQRTLQVSGNGQVSAQPDVAVVSLGVQTEAEEAAAALNENSQKMQDLVDVLRQADVADADIQTQMVRLQPRYADKPDAQGQQEVVGYTASNVVEVRLRNLDTVGQILDAAVQAGGNRIDSIRFEVSDPATYLDQAREAAWNDAQHKAEQLAALAGSDLGPVLTINESSQSPQPIYERAVGGATAAAVPIEAGSQTISVNLQVTWSLADQE
jgi:uncharacterized protein YggE